MTMVAEQAHREHHSHRRKNGRWEARLRTRLLVEPWVCAMQDPLLHAGYRGFRDGFHRYEFLAYFSTPEQRDRFLSVRRKRIKLLRRQAADPVFMERLRQARAAGLTRTATTLPVDEDASVPDPDDFKRGRGKRPHADAEVPDPPPTRRRRDIAPALAAAPLPSQSPVNRPALPAGDAVAGVSPFFGEPPAQPGGTSVAVTPCTDDSAAGAVMAGGGAGGAGGWPSPRFDGSREAKDLEDLAMSLLRASLNGTLPKGVNAPTIQWMCDCGNTECITLPVTLPASAVLGRRAQRRVSRFSPAPPAAMSPPTASWLDPWPTDLPQQDESSVPPLPYFEEADWFDSAEEGLYAEGDLDMPLL